MTLREVHALLTQAYDQTLSVLEQMPIDGLSTDTAGALGFASGSLSKAKALVGRDIDDGERKG